MEIDIKNFGPIRHFDTDLDADFLFIVGDNNIGKSYAISLIYVILKTLTSNEILERPMYVGYFLEEIPKKILSSVKDDFSKSYKGDQGKLINVTDIYRKILTECFKTLFLDQFEKSIAGTFGEISNLENRRDGEDTAIVLKTASASIHLKILNGKILINDIVLLRDIFLRPSKQRRSARLEPNKKIIYGPVGEVSSAIDILAFEALNHFMSFMGEVATKISDVHYLPASRSGLYQALSAFGQIIAELSKQRTFLSQKIELPAISEPLVDYFIKLTEIKQSRRSEESKFSEIADDLEKLILGGSVEFDSKSKRLFYKPFDMNLKLDLSSTSSMVSEVAPIVTYLKYVLPNGEMRKGIRKFRVAKADVSRRKQILFIEEPEAHLHPKNQALLMQFFARLARECDIKIVMTSHSNFVFNKVSNLIINKSFGSSSTKAFLFYRTDQGTLSKALDVDEYGITDENFTEVAEDIFNEKLNLIDAINKNLS
jgi:predicted ATPase